jgi:hypothetical protein
MNWRAVTALAQPGSAFRKYEADELTDEVAELVRISMGGRDDWRVMPWVARSTPGADTGGTVRRNQRAPFLTGHDTSFRSRRAVRRATLSQRIRCSWADGLDGAVQ